MKLQRWDFYIGRKTKYTKEQKVQACEDYLSGRKSAEQIKIELNMGKCGARLVLEWVKSYRVNSHSIFDRRNKKQPKPNRNGLLIDETLNISHIYLTRVVSVSEFFYILQIQKL